MSGKRIVVFVYGTLKTNQPNHHWLTDAANGQSKLLGKGKTCDRYPMVIGTRYYIPFLVKLPGTGKNINGEVYEVDEQMLSKLDELENHPIYYLREEIPIKGNDGSEFQCWTYFLRNYPKDFLTDRTLLDDYENTLEASYVKPEDRPEFPKAIDDLGFCSS